VPSRIGPALCHFRRLKACTDKIQRKALDGYLVTNRTDQYYLTGFDGEDGAVLLLPDRVCLITDGRFKDEVVIDAPWATAVVRTGSLPEAIERLVRRYRVRRLGFQPELLSVQSHAILRRRLRPARLVPLPDLVTQLRLLKDEGEVAALEKAARVAEDAFRTLLRKLRPGMTEIEVAARLEYEMHRRGASGPSFPTIVAEGPNSALPHARPGDRRIRVGSALLIDWGATVDRYRSDLTRVVFIRRIPPRFRRMYENVLAAQAEAIEAVAPGVRMCDVDARARRLLTRAGMGRQFSHGLGHGVGLDIHEAPRLAKKVTDRLAAGMVVTAEPGVYYPGVGGVRIEDDVLVTEKGHRIMTSLPKELDDMVI
jgi:Xaa-Pro aminopeptidase